jgi:ribonuclease HI
MFVNGQDPSLNPESKSFTQKFYGVRSGKVPGVYTDWATAEMQVKGVQKPKFKCVLFLLLARNVRGV